MNNLSVFIIDDDPENVLMMEDMARMMGFDVLTSYDPYNVVPMAYEHQPALIILDMSFYGDRDGLDVARELHMYAETQHIPILGITADLFRYKAEEVLAAGCDAYLAKPFAPRNFRETIRALIQQQPA